MPILGSFFLGGLCAAVLGIVFGLASVRIRGFYIAVATLACQFGWFSNHSSSGVITGQKMSVFGYALDSPQAKYLLTLAVVAALALVAKNLVRSATAGLSWRCGTWTLRPP